MNKQLIKYFVIFILSIIINFCFLKKILNLSIINVSVISIVICLITLIIDSLLNNKVIDFFQQKQDPKYQKEVMDKLHDYEKRYQQPTHQPTHSPNKLPPCSIDIIHAYDKDKTLFDNTCNIHDGRKFWGLDTHKPDTHKPDTPKPDTHKPDTHTPDTHTSDTHKQDTHKQDTHTYGVCSHKLTKTLIKMKPNDIKTMENENKCLFVPHHYKDLYKEYKNPYNTMNWDNLTKNLNKPMNITDSKMHSKINNIDTLINNLKDNEKSEDEYIKKLKNEINRIQDKNNKDFENNQTTKKKLNNLIKELNNIKKTINSKTNNKEVKPCSYINLSDSYTPIDQFNYKILNN